MPYPNEHAARLQDPKRMNPDSYRTTAGGKIFGGRITVPSTINILWAKFRGKSAPSDPPILQALRFKKENWTATEARKWLEDNGVKFKIFERAAETANEDEGVFVKIYIEEASKQEIEEFNEVDDSDDEEDEDAEDEEEIEEIDDEHFWEDNEEPKEIIDVEIV